MDGKIDEFGKKIVGLACNPATSAAELLKNKYAKGPARLTLNDLHAKTVEAVLDIVVPELVDDAIFHLMRAIDFGDLKLTYRIDAGRDCGLEKTGMLEPHGWLFGEEGWTARYSSFSLSQSAQRQTGRL